MAYAFVQDVAASWERYELETAVAISPAPEGLILHLAGPTAEGFRVIEVWEDEAAWLRFRDERLAPALASTTRPAIPEPTFRDVRVVHLVTGESRRGDLRRSVKGFTIQGARDEAASEIRRCR